MALGHAQRRFIMKETAVSLVLGGCLPAASMYAFMGGFPVPLLGADGFAAFLAKNSLGMGTVMSLLMTLAVRSRVAKGSAPALEPGVYPILRFYPRNVMLRALGLGLLALITAGAASILLALAYAPEQVTRLAFALAIGAQSLTIAAFLTPLILIGALSDIPHRPRSLTT